MLDSVLKNDEKQDRNFKILIYIATVAIVFLALAGRLFYLQYIQYEENFQRSENNRMRRIVLTAERGSLFDRNEKVIVFQMR